MGGDGDDQTGLCMQLLRRTGEGLDLYRYSRDLTVERCWMFKVLSGNIFVVA